MKAFKKLFYFITIAASTAAFAQEKAATPDEVAWMEYMTPGPMHESLAKSNGMWSEEITMWMAPGAPEIKSKATAMNKMIMGGRYQQSMHRGTFNGKPFEGMSLLGFDNAKQKFVSTWIDNMGTGIMYLEGVWNEKENTIEFAGTQFDPIQKKDVGVRETYKIVDENNHMMEMFMTDADGKEFKSMNIMLTKKAMQEGKTDAEGKGETPVKPEQPKMNVAPKKTGNK